jgi:hypothetical protein
MTRTVSGFAAATALAIAFAATPTLAGAAANPFPAVSQPVCENTYSGVWSEDTTANPNIRTCTVNGQTMTVAGSHPVQAWTVVVSMSAVYVKQGGTEWTEGGDWTVTACYNHRGHQIIDYQTNPHCQPAGSQ